MRVKPPACPVHVTKLRKPQNRLYLDPAGISGAWLVMCSRLKVCLQGERVTLTSGLAYTHFLLSFLRRVYKAVRLTQVGGLPCQRTRVTLADGVTFSLVNTPGRVNPLARVNFLIVSRPFEYNRALSCPGL